VVKVPLSLLAVIIDCHDPRRQAEWWARALAYKVSQRDPDEFLVSDPADAGQSLYFMKVPEPNPASFENPDTWTVMRDPEGNEFCVTSTSTLTGLE
jgi:hypothetical protein